MSGNGLTIEAEIALTMRACDPATNQQEAAFLDVLSDRATFDIVDDGAILIVTSTRGDSITAHR